MKHLANYLILIVMLLVAGNVSSTNGIFDRTSPLPEQTLAETAIGFLLCGVLLFVVNYKPKKDKGYDNGL